MNNKSNFSLVLSRDSKISSAQIVWYSVFTLESVFILILNSMALCIFFQKNFLKKQSTFLLINLTFADLMVGLTIPFIFAVDFVDDFDVKIAFYLPSLLAAFGSLFSLTGIALERVFAIFWPFRHRLLKRSHYFWYVGLSWFIASVISFILLKDVMGYHWLAVLVNDERPALTYLQICLTLFLTVLIISSYAAIWIKVTFYKRFNTQRNEQENKKMAKTLSIVTLLFLITWWPENIYEKLDDLGSNQSIEYGMYCLVYSNSFLNCIVYSVRMPEFRKELVKMLRKAKSIICFRSRNPVEVETNSGSVGRDNSNSRQVELKSVRQKTDVQTPYLHESNLVQ